MNGQDTPVRVLTVHQPFAWALVAGHKDVENRPWRFAAPAGTVMAILAGRGYDPPLPVDYVREPLVFVHRAIIGSVVVIGSHWADDCAGAQGGICSPWAMAGKHHWDVCRPVMLDEPLPARGMLHLAYATPEQTHVIERSRKEAGA